MQLIIRDQAQSINAAFASKALLSEFFGLGVSRLPPFDCLHHAFELFARTQPELVAVEDFEETITFHELDRHSSCLASHLRTMGIVPGSRVCLLVERSIAMVIGILAVLKAGGAYIPLDGNVVSDATLIHALKDTEALVALVQSKFEDRVHDLPVICLEKFTCKHSPTERCRTPEDLSAPNDSAYIIYTSGTPCTFPLTTR